jgi:drug/metabolite transporter (DMT)-like permease
VGLALIAALGFGGFFVGIAAASQADPWSAILFQRTTGLVLIVAAVAVARPRLAVGARMSAALAVVGVLDLTANLLFALASTRGLVSLVGLLGSLYPVVTVLLARGVLREHLRPLQWAGAGGAVVGVAMISAG